MEFAARDFEGYPGCLEGSSSSVALQPGVGLGLLYNTPPSLRGLF